MTNWNPSDLTRTIPPDQAQTATRTHKNSSSSPPSIVLLRRLSTRITSISPPSACSREVFPLWSMDFAQTRPLKISKLFWVQFWMRSGWKSNRGTCRSRVRLCSKWLMWVRIDAGERIEAWNQFWALNLIGTETILGQKRRDVESDTSWRDGNWSSSSSLDLYLDST